MCSGSGLSAHCLVKRLVLEERVRGEALVPGRKPGSVPRSLQSHGGAPRSWTARGLLCHPCPGAGHPKDCTQSLHRQSILKKPFTITLSTPLKMTRLWLTNKKHRENKTETRRMRSKRRGKQGKVLDQRDKGRAGSRSTEHALRPPGS